MGQAKQRGTFDERVAQARARDFPNEAAEIRRRDGLPKKDEALILIDTPRQQRKASMAMARLMAASLVIGRPKR